MTAPKPQDGNYPECVHGGPQHGLAEPVSEPPAGAGQLGITDASRIIAAQYAAGVSTDELAAHHDDVSARLAADAQTKPGREYAREYALTAASLIADLRGDEAAARTGRPAPGTPHPDPRLAARGWEVHRTGVYARRQAEPEPEREAG